MSHRLSCPQGHVWDTDLDASSSNGATLTCPICGKVGQHTTVTGEANAERETATQVGKAVAAADSLATRPPAPPASTDDDAPASDDLQQSFATLAPGETPANGDTGDSVAVTP